MSSMTRSFKNLLINPRFQGRFIGYFLGLFFVMTLSLYSTTFLFFWKLRQKAISVGIKEDHIFHQFLSNQKAEMDFLFIGLTIFNFLLLLIFSVLISHRIAGPIKKLKGHLQSPGSEEFSLRKNDFFQDLVPVINEVKKKIKQ
jgi:hypothetical protein